MSVLQALSSSDKWPEGSPTHSLIRLKLLYRKMAYLEANKWLKDNELIARYKGKRSLSAFEGTGWKRVTWNIVKSIVKDGLNDIPLCTELKKSGPTRVCLAFSDGQPRYLAHGGAERTRRTQWATGLSAGIRDLDTKLTLTLDGREANWNGNCKVFVDYEKINLLSIDSDRITLAELQEEIVKVKTGLIPVMERGQAPANAATNN